MARGRRLEPISIHALREESDARKTPSHQTKKISIHALREESDIWQIDKDGE